jgi:hypothetical protein
MPIDNVDFGPKNFKIFLSDANEALKIKYLTPDDRETIQQAMSYCMQGNWLLGRDDPESLRRAAWLLFTGGYFLGSRCSVCDTEAEYWRRKRCAKGGARTSPSTADWQRWVLEKMAKHPDVKPSAMASSLLVEKARPSNLPGYDHLVRFVRASRKRDQSKIRLIHSA